MTLTKQEITLIIVALEIAEGDTRSRATHETIRDTPAGNALTDEADRMDDLINKLKFGTAA